MEKLGSTSVAAVNMIPIVALVHWVTEGSAASRVRIACDGREETMIIGQPWNPGFATYRTIQGTYFTFQAFAVTCEGCKQPAHFAKAFQRL